MEPNLMTTGLLELIENSVRQNWDNNAFTDFHGETLRYKDVARKIEKMHLLMSYSGIKKGDKIAVCGRNSGNWCVAFLATITYGAVVVPILHEFKADNIHNIVNHSEARLLFVGDYVWENLNEEEMPLLEGVVCLNDFSLLASRSDLLVYARENLNALFGAKYPARFRAEHVHYYHEESPEDLVIINYTSGTTGFSKGVMLPCRSILSNILFCRDKIGLQSGDRVVSMLPLGHVFGLVFDFIYGVTAGVHLFFLTRMPSPKVIKTTVAEIHPRVISCVPLVVEKLFKQEVLPKLDNTLGKLLLRVPYISDRLKDSAREEGLKLFGGNLMEVIIGGAPFNAEMEDFLRSLHFPYAIAYGMTECGPIIAHSPWNETACRSCGKVADRMSVKVNSADPQRIPGELLCRGENMMLGYYKNPEATAQVIDEQGWLHTGDMAILSASGDIYIKGRCKNMLLSPNGQNIYPEELEAKWNNMPYVNESLVIMHEHKLVVLVYPDLGEAVRNGLTEEQLVEQLETNRLDINKELAAYEQITRVVLRNEEFEKTAKKSIKRYLYQEISL